MIVAHLSDLHLGFRAYDRVERGVDLRERDVAAAFERAVQEVVRRAPDVIVVAGDVFDRPDPPASSVVALARGLEVFRTSLPSAPVLMVAGPRDTPRRPGDPGALAVLDTFPNVEAATSLTRSIMMRNLDLHACLVPYQAAVRHPPARPEADPRMAWNLLVMHGSAGAAGHGVVIEAEEWDYVALGGDHRRRKVGPRARYSGSLERVALDPWSEAADEKGFLTVDLATGEADFHPIPGRPVVALAPVKVAPGDPMRLQRRVREVMDEVPGGIDDKIVRLKLDGATPYDLLALQGEPLADLRMRALHLAIEAGKAPVAPPDAWISADRADPLRRALEAELRHDEHWSEETQRIVDTVLAAAPDPPALLDPVGAIDALDGTIPGLGRVSTSISPGLTAVIGGRSRARRAVAQLLVREGEGDGSGHLRRLWAGGKAETIEDTIRLAVAAVGAIRGLAHVEAAHDWLGEQTRDAGPEPESPGVPEPRPVVHVDPEQLATEFRSAEKELRDLRGDVVEVDGDVEVATMDWLRERQDAETTLNTYRDQARELRARIRTMEAGGPDAPCPTCGRLLESHHQEVLDELRDQWEGVVQDGGWWKSRWEQLELKPVRLQEIEGRSLRLHAALETASERVELLRARLADVDRRATGVRDRSLRGGADGAVVDALRRVKAAREAVVRDLLLDRTSRFLCRITGGRVLAITLADGIASLQGDRGALTPTSEEDLAAARIAVRLAAASLVAGRGRVLASFVVEEPFDRLDAEVQARTVVLMKKLLREIPRFVLFSRGAVVDACPELFDSVLEVRDEVSNAGALLRPVPAGSGHAVFVSATSIAPRAHAVTDEA